MFVIVVVAAATLRTYASPSSPPPSSSDLVVRGGDHGPGRPCPPLKKGSFVIDRYQLYPENADWDAASCLVWFGALFNSTVAAYDPYSDKFVDIIKFPGFTRNPKNHIGGVGWDQNTGLVSILISSAIPWETWGSDVSGEYLVVKYNPLTKKTHWTANITTISKGAYGGFQDVEHDVRGNTYVVGTWPGTIVRISKTGKTITPWYVPNPLPPTTTKGVGGLAVVGETLLSNDGNGQILRFDLRADRGTPVLVPIQPKVIHDDTDAIYLPPKYGGKVLLVASNFGGVLVYRSRDKTWRTSEYLGAVPRPNGTLYDGAATTGVVQIGSNSIYSIIDWIDPFVDGVAGGRSLFPMPDITKQVEDLF
ncbi:hypothetical protein B0T24DRAFT_645276 [Lasiosphaeria ovina]|uniref:Tri14-like protein n=1 Tax=Lasiosphaeria ovina TaxID=92902 RepID=A0AAE0TWZ4_9PEZI|nr:hypothetical protein B0T24DRAFT_645276 [Lasiosphaeria ovina]